MGYLIVIKLLRGALLKKSLGNTALDRQMYLGQWFVTSLVAAHCATQLFVHMEHHS